MKRWKFTWPAIWGTLGLGLAVLLLGILAGGGALPPLDDPSIAGAHLDPPGPPPIRIIVEVTGVAEDQKTDDEAVLDPEIDNFVLSREGGHAGTSRDTDLVLSTNYVWATFLGNIMPITPVEIYRHDECTPMNKITITLLMEDDEDIVPDIDLGTGTQVWTAPGEKLVETSNNGGDTGKIRINVRAVPLANNSCRVKVVPIKFCVLSDGNDKDDKNDQDDGRFTQDKRIAGLLEKSRLFAQAGVLFKPQGFVTVPDVDRVPGDNLGDVADVSKGEGDGGVEWKKIKTRCDKKIGEDAREKLVDILIRDWVRVRVGPKGEAVGSSASAVGWSQKPICTKLPFVNAKPTTADPDRLGANFGETLAHENGHGMCLDHTKDAEGNEADLDKRIMNPTTFGNDKFTVAEREKIRAEAQKISGTIDKNKNGERLSDPRPRSKEAVDDAGDVPDVQIDITDSTAVRLADGALGLSQGLAGLVPDDITGLEYVFIVDVDNDTGTGGSPVVSFPHSFTGADLVAEITVSKTAGVPSVTVVAKQFEAGTFVPIVDSRIEGDLTTLTAVSKGGEGGFPFEDVVSFLLPSDLLPVPLAEGYRVGSFAFDGNTLDLDQAPIVVGSITEFPEPQSIMIDPITAEPGDTVLITGEEFNPNSTVEIFVGTQLVVTLPTAGAGSFAGDFTVPPVDDDTFIFNEDWDEFVSPVTAIDTTTTLVGEQIEKKSDAVILQLPRKKVGGIVELPADTDSPAEASASARDYTAPIAVAVAAGALAVGGWYARRRFLR